MNKHKKICMICKQEYLTKNPRYFLCPDCARKAFQDHECPNCGSEVSGKPLCAPCARAYAGTVGHDSVRCSYVTATGHSCKNWAMKGSYYCWNHAKVVKE